MICFLLAKQKPEPISITSALRNYRKTDKVQFTNALHDLVSSQPAGLDSESLFDWYVSGIIKGTRYLCSIWDKVSPFEITYALVQRVHACGSPTHSGPEWQQSAPKFSLASENI